MLTKSQFAKRMHRVPSCVTRWIEEGKITKAAMIGEGHRARIWAERAETDLAASLNASQQFSQAFPANAGPDAWLKQAVRIGD
ncbi:hypothetical protein HU675_0010700 [Bradyrhizobium septentrionale]|uniref:hypothetical protein n=1 Tax=Bradyrhizobium septentrionale TaxID=1404411 RepID=UPI0015967BF0|nr:hypothetical protein [Bradyrhizobium septentrionale]UGY27179.1 hypothetical protein HU675_0010700 [Bradyrhizobium septentrionale]